MCGEGGCLIYKEVCVCVVRGTDSVCVERRVNVELLRGNFQCTCRCPIKFRRAELFALHYLREITITPGT